MQSTFVYNWYTSTTAPSGVEWVCREADSEEIGDRDPNGGTISLAKQIPIATEELPKYARALWYAFSGNTQPRLRYRSEFIRWVGANGGAVAAALHWGDFNE